MAMESQVKLTTSGLTQSADKEAIHAWLASRLKGTPQEIDTLIGGILAGRPTELAKNASQAKAEALQKELAVMGLLCDIQPMQLALLAVADEAGGEKQYECPACGHKQAPAVAGVDLCEKCNVNGALYAESQERAEAARLERERAKELQAAELAQKYKKAREKVEKRAKRHTAESGSGKPSMTVIVIGLLILIGITAFVWKLQKKPVQAPKTAVEQPAIGMHVATFPHFFV